MRDLKIGQILMDKIDYFQDNFLLSCCFLEEPEFFCSIVLWQISFCRSGAVYRVKYSIFLSSGQ